MWVLHSDEASCEEALSRRYRLLLTGYRDIAISSLRTMDGSHRGWRPTIRRVRSRICFYLRSVTSRDERIRTVADGLVLSNTLMIVLNMSAGYLPTYLVLCLLMIILGAAFILALRLPEVDRLSAVATSHSPDGRQRATIVKPLAFLCLFIALITVNSGLMYQVINPAYAHLQWLAIWYWALPYIVAICVMRNLPRSTPERYMLYVAIAMMALLSWLHESTVGV